MELKQRSIDRSVALPYMIDFVRNFGKSLSQSVLRNKMLDQGRFFVFLPEHLSQRKAENLSSGYIESEGVTKKLCAYLEEGLSNNSDLYIFEDAYAEPLDSSLASFQTEILTHKREVFFLVDSKGTGSDRWDRVIRKSSSAMGILALRISLTIGDPWPRKGEEATDVEMDIWGQRIVSVIVSAYDAEGYLVWTKN